MYDNSDSPCSFCTNQLILEKKDPKGLMKGEYIHPKTGRWYECRGRAIRWTDGRRVRLEIGTDITDLKLAERRDKLQLIRLEAFLTLLGMVDSDEKDILDFTLEKSLLVSDSQYAFVGLITPDEYEMVIHTWSKGAMEVCSVTEKPIHFPLQEAGIWGECIRNHAPFICNDYSCEHPAKHGCPKGHVPITRFLGVPIRDGETIVAILAVANKTGEYDNEDINTLLTLGNIMWEMIHRGRVRDELIQASRYNRTLIETSPDPLVTIGKDGKITDVNSATEKVTGYFRTELVGTDFSEYFTDPQAAREGYLGVFEKGEVRDYPLAIRHNDGTITDVLYNASVYLNEIGEIAGVFAAARDITERKKIENKLYQQEERYRLALQATNDVIWDFDVINDAQRWNEAGIEVFGWSDIVFADQTAAWWTDRVHPEDRERVSEGFDAALEDPLCTNWHDEYRFRRSDGEYAYVMDRGYILRNSEGAPIRMIGAMLDISERKKAEEALRHANRQINLLTSITRHDIINKTTVIFNSLGVAEMDISDPSILHRLDVIKSATKDIKSQIEFTRVYQNLGTHEPQWCRLDSIRLSIPIGIQYTSEAGDYEVYADPMISQVFVNLLDNSLRHGERVTRIMLTTHLKEDSLIIRWEDNGAGIPIDQKEQIFERGFGKNTGFGLFLVREVLQITGMSIRESGIFGSGAVFEIIVPKGVYRTIHPAGE